MSNKIVENNDIVIPLSKTKIALLILGAVLFVLSGVVLWSIAEVQTRFSPVIVKFISSISIIFFGGCGIYGIVKLFDGQPGLIINNEGILDNSSAVSSGIIKWNDIKSIEIENIKGTKFLLIFVHNPNVYLNEANLFRRLWMKLNEKFYGTPFSISSNSLNCNFEFLQSKIQQFRKSN